MGEKGIMAEQGTHGQLLALDGWYASQWRYQQLEASLDGAIAPPLPRHCPAIALLVPCWCMRQRLSAALRWWAPRGW